MTRQGWLLVAGMLVLGRPAVSMLGAEFQATDAERVAEAEKAVVAAAAMVLEARSRAAEAEARAAEAEARAAEAEVRAAEWEVRAAEAMAVSEEIAATAAAAADVVGTPTDKQWEEARVRATRYGRPDRTSEDDLGDGSHYDQSSDDRSYSEHCAGAPTRLGMSGFRYEIRSNTKSIHWRWKQTSGGLWRVYFDGADVSAFGEHITRVADTVTAWYEFRPPERFDREADFVILVACTTSGVDEIDIHYHH